MNLTQDQVTNVLLNAHGFVDAGGSVYYAQRESMYASSFELYSQDLDVQEYEFHGATLKDGVVTFNRSGGRDAFGILIAASYDVQVHGQCVFDHLMS